MQKLLFVADLGRLKAFRLDENPAFSRPRLELLEDWETPVTQKLSEEVTDQAGQFRKGRGNGDGPNAMSDGEQHNIHLEKRRRALKAMAKHIQEMMDREHASEFYLAADSRMNELLLQELTPATRGRLQKNVSANLSRLNPQEIIQQFCE